MTIQDLENDIRELAHTIRQKDEQNDKDMTEIAEILNPLQKNSTQHENIQRILDKMALQSEKLETSLDNLKQEHSFYMEEISKTLGQLEIKAKQANELQENLNTLQKQHKDGKKPKSTTKILFQFVCYMSFLLFWYFLWVIFFSANPQHRKLLH